MTITLSEQTFAAGVRHIIMKGIIDSAASREQDGEVFEYVTGPGGTVLLDLSELEYIASSGLRVLLRCARALKEANGELHIAAPQPRVMSVLTIGGYVTLFPVYQTLQEAKEILSR